MLIPRPKIHSLDRVLSRGQILEISYLGRSGQKISRGKGKKLVAALEILLVAVEKLLAAVKKLVAVVEKLVVEVKKLVATVEKLVVPVEKLVATWSKNKSRPSKISRGLGKKLVLSVKLNFRPPRLFFEHRDQFFDCRDYFFDHRFGRLGRS